MTHKPAKNADVRGLGGWGVYREVGNGGGKDGGGGWKGYLQRVLNYL